MRFVIIHVTSLLQYVITDCILHINHILGIGHRPTNITEMKLTNNLLIFSRHCVSMPMSIPW